MPSACWRKLQRRRGYADGWQLYYGDTAIAVMSGHAPGWIVSPYDPRRRYRYPSGYRFADTEAEAQLVGIDLAIAVHEQMDHPRLAVIAALRAYREQLEQTDV